MKKKGGVQCPNCKEEIFSEHRHDFKECKCKQTFVDGGNSYLRYGGKDIEKIKVVTKES
jgi:hypothetical protein